MEIEEPTFYQEAIDAPNQKEWMDAMRDEIDPIVDLLSQRKYIEMSEFSIQNVRMRPLYVCQRINRGILFLTLYVGDILLARNNLELIEATKKWLSYVF